MTDTLWMVVVLQMAMGGFDSLYHHELTERLAWRPAQKCELRLHGVRNLGYAVLFTALGWTEPRGLAAAALGALLVVELFITLWDFVEEDRTRRLAASERLLHTLLTLNYGVFLALYVPSLIGWMALPTEIVPRYSFSWSWLCAIAALGVIVSGLRDLAVVKRAARLVLADPAPLARQLDRRHSVLVTGGTGFVGSRLVTALVAAGHDVTVLTRSHDRAAGLPAPLKVVTELDQIDADVSFHAIVNLAGEPISDGLWTGRKRRRILRSRLAVTREVVRLIGRLRTPPRVLVSGSAIGWYGLRDDVSLDETSAGRNCFSRQVCLRWERAAMPAATIGTRVVLLRTGLVLAGDGGMLSRLLPAFDLALGGRFGSGRHWMSWIHRDDLVRLIVHIIARPHLDGPINATAPEPVRNDAFTAALAHALGRPAVLPVPAGPLRLILGGFARELLLGGQRVVPRAAILSGFHFLYPSIEDALGQIIGRAKQDDVAAKPRKHDPTTRGEERSVVQRSAG
jgi:uncharacterized protein (TIGR01777 family)